MRLKSGERKGGGRYGTYNQRKTGRESLKWLVSLVYAVSVCILLDRQTDRQTDSCVLKNLDEAMLARIPIHRFNTSLAIELLF